MCLCKGGVESTHLGKASPVGPDDGHIAGLRIVVVERNVLLHGKLDRCIGGYGGTRVFTNVLSIKDMLLYCEQSLGHGCGALGVDRMTCERERSWQRDGGNKGGTREN